MCSGSSFSPLLNWKLRVLIWDHLSFLIYVFNAGTFAIVLFCIPQILTLYFFFFRSHFWFFSLIHGLFRSMLCSLEIFGHFPEIFLLLVSNWIQLQSENLLCITYIILNVLRLVLQPRIRSLLENALCTVGNSEVSAVIGWSSINIS